VAVDPGASGTLTLRPRPGPRAGVWDTPRTDQLAEGFWTHPNLWTHLNSPVGGGAGVRLPLLASCRGLAPASTGGGRLGREEEGVGASGADWGESGGQVARYISGGRGRT
jgi:hypothetical protein